MPVPKIIWHRNQTGITLREKPPAHGLFGDLHGVEGSAFAQIVAHDPECQPMPSFGKRLVATDAPDINVISAR